MIRTSLIRIVHFHASHRYGRAGRSAAWNAQRFGEQVHAHEHDFRVEIQVSGPVEAETGFVVDLARLDAALDELVTLLDGSDLNEVIPEVRRGDVQPSTEELARWILCRLAPSVPAPAVLRRVRVWESDVLAGEAEKFPDRP